MTREHSNKTLIAIGLFRLVKGVLLAIVGFGILRLLHRDISQAVELWTARLHVDPDNRYIHAAIAKILAVSPKQLKEVGFGSFFYSALLLTEGTGLMLGVRWAEYLTVIGTSLLLPVEVYEIGARFTWFKVLVLAVNGLIVAYLVHHLRARSAAIRRG